MQKISESLVENFAPGCDLKRFKLSDVAKMIF